MPVIDVIDPATGEAFARVEDGGAAAVDAAVVRARASFDAGVWRGLPASQRARVLWRAAELVEARIEELAAEEARNVGMSPMLAKALIGIGTELLRYYAGWCTKLHGQTTDLTVAGGLAGGASHYHAYTLLEPVGVVGLIVPWNGPLMCALAKLAPALAAGCSCILKPAEETPLTALKLEAILVEAGLPEGVVTVVNGRGETTGAAISAHPGIDKVAFTGSTEVGKIIARAATGNLKRVTLELGGKSPVLIFADADLSRAIPGAAMGLFTNAGQACTAGSRIFAHRDVYDEVVEGIAAIARGLRLGGSDEAADIGPLISQRQRERVHGLVEDGVRCGARVVCGGQPLDRAGFFYQPTVMTGVTTDMALYREEIFGPVAAIMPFDDEADAIAEANNSEYGLAAQVWTRDVSRAHLLAKRIDSGTVWVNCAVAFDPSMPFGGFKQSGWGQEYGWEGIRIYLRSKSVFVEL